MNSNTQPSRTATSARRALPALAVVALAVGLTACQTPPQGTVVPKAHVVVSVPVPAGVDLGRPADRIAEQLQQAQAQHDAEVAQLEQRFAGVPADRIAETLQREQAAEHALTAVQQRAGAVPEGAE